MDQAVSSVSDEEKLADTSTRNKALLNNSTLEVSMASSQSSAFYLKSDGNQRCFTSSSEAGRVPQ
tara:strand:+ start:12323 stop:12517 length:195 start_codon:yes stop_codon:yes gene_type:complete